MPWSAVESGSTLGTMGAEGGEIVLDEEHALGARITLESDSTTAPFAVTCGIYGWMFHTRYFEGEAQARGAVDEMKRAMAEILAAIPASTDPEAEAKAVQASQAIGRFVERFP